MDTGVTTDDARRRWNRTRAEHGGQNVSFNSRFWAVDYDRG